MYKHAYYIVRSESAFENALRSDCVRSRGTCVRMRSGHKMRVLDSGSHCSNTWNTPYDLGSLWKFPSPAAPVPSSRHPPCERGSSPFGKTPVPRGVAPVQSGAFGRVRCAFGLCSGCVRGHLQIWLGSQGRVRVRSGILPSRTRRGRCARCSERVRAFVMVLCWCVRKCGFKNARSLFGSIGRVRRLKWILIMCMYAC